MTILSKLIPAFPLALFALPIGAQDEHFGDFRWRERQTDHFTLRAAATRHDPAARNAEKLWDICVGIMPGLIADFEEGAFRTPEGTTGTDEPPFRFTVYLLGEADHFRELVDFEARRRGWTANDKNLVHRVANFSDPQNRYTVFCKVNAAETGGGNERDITSIFIHSTASSILKGRARQARMPFFLTAGFGYYAEHLMTDLCRVHYLDFEAYFKEQEVEMHEGETLGPDESWAKVLRKMCGDGERSSLQEVCSAQILTLSPKQSGYIFALTYFLVRNDQARGHYRQLLATARAGGTLDKDVILKTYGFEDDEAFESAWYEWMESREFK